MAFIDLSVKGKASPRHERPFSGKRVSYAYKNTNTKSNIFGIDDNEAMPKREISKSALNAKSSEKSLSPDVESYSNAITTQSVSVKLLRIVSINGCPSKFMIVITHRLTLVYPNNPSCIQQKGVLEERKKERLNPMWFV